MTVNIFSLEMAEAYLKGAEPSKHLIYSNEALDSYYKLFTTGFETESNVVNCVDRDGKFIALLDTATFVATPGCMVKTDVQARVLKIDKRDNKCELTLDAQIAAGKLTVCGLGFVAVGKDETARTFTVRDSVFGNEMTFKLNFRDSETAIKKNESLVEVTALGTTSRLLHQNSQQNNSSKDQTNIAQWRAWRSFISNGSWLWYSAKNSSMAQLQNLSLSDLENFFCGWLSKTEFVAPHDAYMGTNVACNIAGSSGIVYETNGARGYIKIHGAARQIIPTLVKPWAVGNINGSSDQTWLPTFSLQVELLGNGYLFWESRMVKLPGIQYAPLVSYHMQAGVFEYGSKLIYTSDALFGNIPHYFSLDDKDWVQDE